MNREALLNLWQLEDLPACPKGMEFAKKFLECAGEAVDRLGVEEPGDRMTELTAAYTALVEHSAECPDRNEV